jgi:O-acetylserine/cysteine efflux transporter
MATAATDARSPASLATRDLGLLFAIDLIWGFNLIASKVGVETFPPIFFTSMRFGVLSLLLIPVLRWHRGQMRVLALSAASMGALSFGFLFLGVQQAQDVSSVAIATQLGVPMQTLLSVWLLGERIRWRRILGIVLSFAGIIVIGFDPRVLEYWLALVLVIVSCFFSSIGLIYIKGLAEIRALEIQAWVSTVSWPLLLVMSLLFEHGQWLAMQSANWTAWSALAYTMLMSNLVAHTGMYYLVRRYPVTSVAPLTLLSPIFSIVFGVMLLNDHLTPRMLVGGAITLIGVLIVMLRQKQIVDTGS